MNESQDTATSVGSAYRDAEGWVLFDAAGDPVDWPTDWPDEIDAGFLRERGITIAEGARASVESEVVDKATPQAIDFSCYVCGVECAVAPDPPARAVCPEHCEDHDYVHDSSRAAKFCQHCDQEEPEDWR